MPSTAALEDIKAHQQRGEKDKIAPDNPSMGYTLGHFPQI